jgi:uncharacterized protein YbjT (DUF2867 family)
MSDKKTIAVVGATGAQGGGLVRAILSDTSGSFRARALTRDVNSPKAKELAAAGAEVVAANVDDVESLKKAFAGAHGAFCVTFFWDHFSPDREKAQAKAMADAAAATGVAHVIWSTLEDTRKWVPLTDDRMPTLMGNHKVPHFEAKAESDAYFGAAGAPTTFLLTSFYWENFIYFGMGPRKGPDGKLVLAMPMGAARLGGIAAEDIGRSAYGIFREGPGLAGQRIGIVGEALTGSAMAAQMSEALGQPVEYQAVPFDVYRGLGFPGAEDLGNMFQIYTEFEKEFLGARDVKRTKALNPQLQDFRTWLARNKDRIPIAG